MNITIREPGSALTHFIAMLLALCAAVPLLVRAAVHSGVKSLTAMTVFMISMVLLYAASTIYHSVNCSGRVLRIFRKMDHMMIFILIAGTYTPVCLLTLPKPSGLMLLAAVWGIALVGILSKASGSPVQNGFPLFCISQWAGAACPFWDSCFPSFRFTPFYGCSPAD